MSRYILDFTNHKDNNPEVTALIKKADELLSKKIDSQIESGNLTALKMFRALGEDSIRKGYGRMEMPVDFISPIIEKIKAGRLTIEESTWGKYEVRDKEEGTGPGVEDFNPMSFGYGTEGGPRHIFTFSEKQIDFVVEFAHQDLSGWDGPINTYWEDRWFKIRINSSNDNEIEEILSIFTIIIKERFVQHEKKKMLDSMAETLVENMMNKILK